MIGIPVRSRRSTRIISSSTTTGLRSAARFTAQPDTSPIDRQVSLPCPSPWRLPAGRVPHFGRENSIGKVRPSVLFIVPSQMIRLSLTFLVSRQLAESS